MPKPSDINLGPRLAFRLRVGKDVGYKNSQVSSGFTSAVSCLLISEEAFHRLAYLEVGLSCIKVHVLLLLSIDVALTYYIHAVVALAPHFCSLLMKMTILDRLGTTAQHRLE